MLQGRDIATAALQNGTGGAENASGPVTGVDVWSLPGLSVIPELLHAYITAAVILVVGWYLSRLAVLLAGRTVAKHIDRPSITQTVLRGIRIAVVALAVALAASRVGFTSANILLSVTVFSAVLVIVLAPIVGSVINGLFVLADQPYEIGDMIELADRGQRGFVEDVTIRYTKIFTLDNTFIVIPNSSIRERDVINYSAEDERTRLSITVVVTYESDVQQARTLIERAARQVDPVITGGPDIRIGSARYPAAPTCYLDQYGDNGVHLTLRYWAKQPYKLLTVRSLVQTNLREALSAAEDVEVAYPHRHHVFDETSGVANVAVGDRGGPNAPGGGDPPPGPTDAGSESGE